MPHVNVDFSCVCSGGMRMNLCCQWILLYESMNAIIVQTEILNSFYFPVTSPRIGGYRGIITDGFVSPSTSVAPMFPCFENSAEWDDFGEVINPDDYVIKEDDINQANMHVSVIDLSSLSIKLEKLKVFCC